MGTAVVCGGNRGIGIGWVTTLLKKGYDVIATYRDKTKLGIETTLDKFNHVSLSGLKEKYGDQLKLYRVDIADDEITVCEFVKTIKKVDILVLNAGIKAYKGRGVKPHEHTTEELVASLTVNTVAMDRLMRLFYPLLLKNANSCAVYMSSLVGRTADNGSGGSHVYRAAKAASNAIIWNWSIALMDAWHLKHSENPEELIKTPCAVSICPGWVRTDMGGPDARLSIKESVSDMEKCLIEIVKTKRSNGLYMYTGEIAEAYPIPETLKKIYSIKESYNL